MSRAVAAALFAVAFFAPSAYAARDIRVVLDLSKSMRTNDPGRLAILSTILLHDLARPNTTTGDSFEVIPFDLDWRWPNAAAAPPVSRQTRVRAQKGQRSDFTRAVQALPYDANMTYFYPGVAAAIDDLQRESRGMHDVRAIVLVTDGVPESATRDAELQRIRNELAPRLEQHGIRLYVLAFGAVAAQHRAFFASVVQSPRGASLGEVFVDPNGTQLLSYMLQIFARSFGFSPDSARSLPGTSTLDLEASIKPEWVSVAVLSPQAQTPPSLDLSPPQGGTLHAPDGVQSASVAGGSYSLLWVLAPNPGRYGLTSTAATGTVAVLRPARLALEILPAPPHKQVDRTLAGTPFPLRVLVRPATGAPGDPGPVDLSFRMSGERVGSGASGVAYAWESDRNPPAGAGKATPQGRVFDIVTEFREDPDKTGSIYAGHLEVEVRRGEAVVGSLHGARAHRVEVHPLLSIAPLPLTAYASETALGRREQACTRFTFQLNAGGLPHPDRPKYPVRTVLVANDPTVLQRELRQASFTLDGAPLEFEGQPSPQPSLWSKGRLLAPDELLGDHQLCVQMGKPATGNAGKPLELKLAATLLDDPYDEFAVIRPLQLKVLVAPPTLFERWRFLVIPAALLTGMLGLLWYLRDRPALPPDLHYAVAREASAAGLAPSAFAEAAAANLLGIVAERAVIAPGENRLLGRVRPADKELFQFRPASGVRLESVDGGQTPPLHRGLATLDVHRIYRLQTDRGAYLFRLEYQ
ncbi:MAG TPA: vWA domain-containing protein [Thermoanaerobaculia bacterium]|jgi:hypothetical protein